MRSARWILPGTYCRPAEPMPFITPRFAPFFVVHTLPCGPSVTYGMRSRMPGPAWVVKRSVGSQQRSTWQSAEMSSYRIEALLLPVGDPSIRLSSASIEGCYGSAGAARAIRGIGGHVGAPMISQVQDDRGVIAQPEPAAGPALRAPVVGHALHARLQRPVHERLIQTEAVAPVRRVPRVGALGPPAQHPEGVGPAESIDRVEPRELARAEHRHLL